ncbi:MAG: 4-hydroxy-tetrahydrodipicolinate synthase [Clostridia bacterium]|nr:4-hydroxy-tetrahydrodipicolinate synthase [Clostridia bacterium]
MKKKKPYIFKGCGTALTTPFNENGNGIDFETFGRLIERQIACGADALIVCGTTGEAPTLTDREHIDCIRFAVEKTEGRLTVIAGTGSNSTDHAVYMSQAAEEAGADAVLAVSPYYNKATDSGLIASYTAIADSVGIPLIIYNVPSRTGVDIPVPVYDVLVDHPNIRGIKEASSDPRKLAATVRACSDRADIFTGCDELIFYALACGADGVISVVSNVIPEETANACRGYFRRKIGKARAFMNEYEDLINAMFACVNPIPVKTALSMMGYGNGRLRLPLCPPDKQIEEMISRILRDHGLIKKAE